jgi:hypothetical protein
MYFGETCGKYRLYALVSRRSLTAEGQVRARVSPFGICVDRVALGQCFLRVVRFSPVTVISLWLSTLLYIRWGMNNRPVSGRSSETKSHPIDVNNNNKNRLYIRLEFNFCYVNEN